MEKEVISTDDILGEILGDKIVEKKVLHALMVEKNSDEEFLHMYQE